MNALAKRTINLIRSQLPNLNNFKGGFQLVATFCGSGMSQDTQVEQRSPSFLTDKSVLPGDNTSKRWKKARRRGRLHKRQIEDNNEETSDIKRQKVDEEEDTLIDKEKLCETDYYFENGLRKVYPYSYTYLCYCKERWKGKTILSMLNEEFISESKECHEAQIARGCVKVNGKSIDANYVLRGKNELLSNTVHRHELPVTGELIKVIENNENYVVIDKPASIPVHPCGRYRHNSVIFILAKDLGLTQLRTIYRLDRLTSGLLIFGKNHSATNHMMEHIRERNVSKTYLCKVDGQFPSGRIECKASVDRVHKRIGTWRVKEGGKDAHTSFELVRTDGKSSIVKCWPHTGRTHQIRVHLQYLGHPITNDPLYNHELWGPEKGKGGRYHKTDQELYDELVKNHEITQFEVSDMLELDESTTPSTDDSSHSLRLTPDPNCDWCKKKYKDPQPEQLVMYLHALSYKGPDWEYSTDEPQWSKI